MYQDFKAEVIAKLPQGQDWKLTEKDVADWVKNWRDQRGPDAFQQMADFERRDQESMENWNKDDEE